MKNLFLFLTAFFLLTSCKKDVSELPDATQTGSNTFGARVDGELWKPQQFGVVPASNLLEAHYAADGAVVINARNFSSSPTETEFEIYLKKVTGTGTILLHEVTGKIPNHSASYGYYIKRKFMPLNDWITSDTRTGSVNITRYDSVSKVISGTFSFTAGSIDGTASPISVTDGRFDITIQ